MSFMQNILNKLKAENDTQKKFDAQTIYFKNGKMYKVYPTDKESWYNARYLISDGDIAPKSLSGYTRMKNANSDNFKKIAEAAKKRGINIKSTR